MEHVKHSLDGLMTAAALIGLIHALPEILSATASALSIAWFVIRIYDRWNEKKVTP